LKCIRTDTLRARLGRRMLPICHLQHTPAARNLGQPWAIGDCRRRPKLGQPWAARRRLQRPKWGSPGVATAAGVAPNHRNFQAERGATSRAAGPWSPRATVATGPSGGRQPAARPDVVQQELWGSPGQPGAAGVAPSLGYRPGGPGEPAAPNSHNPERENAPQGQVSRSARSFDGCVFSLGMLSARLGQ
jgi:hypothetical protein